MSDLILLCPVCENEFRFKSRPKLAQPGKSCCSPACYHKRRIGEPLPARSINFSAEEVTQIIAKYQDGVSGVQIARDMGVPYFFIILTLKKNGIPRRNGQGGFCSPTYLDDTQNLEKLRKAHVRGEKHPFFKNLPEQSICNDYRTGNFSMKFLAEVYGASTPTIHKILIKNGVNTSQHTMGKILTCSDGHKAQSSGEFIIDNWLFEHNIVHDIHPRLPWGGHSDFLADSTYIEYWGIEKVIRYDERKKFKMSQYQLHNLSLISIYTKDLRWLDDIFSDFT